MLGSSAVECLTQKGYATRDARYGLDFYISSIIQIESELRAEPIARIHSLHKAVTKFAASFQAIDTRKAIMWTTESEDTGRDPAICLGRVARQDMDKQLPFEEAVQLLG